LLLKRRFNVTAATAFLLAAGVVCALVSSPTDARAQGCGNEADVAVLSAPLAPWKGAPLRVIVAAEKPLEGELTLVAPDGSTAARSRERQGGPPYFWYAEVASPAAGTWHATLSNGHTPFGCTLARDIAVREEPGPRPHASPGSVWPLRGNWNRAAENLYSAWIEKLFDAPINAELSWKALHEVLRDRSRNVLFNYLGLGEDEMRIVLRPDCADLPYFLRAYFAFKMGLPFGYSKCSRGGGGHPPKCYSWFSIVSRDAGASEQSEEASAASSSNDAAAAAKENSKAARARGLAASFGHYLSVVSDAVQSGAGRTLATDDSTDFYMVPLTQATLRPGTIYADPYGHILMLARRVPETNGAAGIFFAVDGEPDGTVARKKFWQGNFLFAQEAGLGNAGFKRFRPIVREENGSLRRLTNAEIAKDPQYGDFSIEQTRLTREQFYDRMDAVMSPEPLDPARAMEDAIASLEEQVKMRVASVENGRKYQLGAHGDATMPAGAAIFATNGAWEDFATPARDFRLLIAIDVVRGFPEHVARHPERYAMPFGKSAADVRADLQRLLVSELAVRKFSYTRSDGSAWTLTLKDVVDRVGELEMAYNLNDCVELRWGAAENSDEASTCKRHAPASQRAKMSEYRAWFHERRWPPRA